MKAQRLFFLINPSSGKHDQVKDNIEPVFEGSGTEITQYLLKKDEDPAEIIRENAVNADLIVVCGGDGSVTSAVAGLIDTKIPLAIIPAGTANVLSKELGIPQGAEAALQLLRDGKYHLQTIDTGVVNGHPFLLRVNMGIMADMITETDPDLKDKIGQLAYGVATVKSIREAEPVKYNLTIDGKSVAAEGVSLTVTNAGSAGIGSLQLLPDISVSDGLLDVVLLKDAGFLSIVKAAGGSLFGRETDVVDHWTCREITIRLPEKQRYLCDDCEAEADEISISIVPASLRVAVPLTDN